MNVKYSEDVLRAKESNKPVLALESTIIAHGMPFPENLTFGKKAESLCRDNGVVPATIAVIDGVPQVGLNQKQLERIAQSENIKKIPRNMLGVSAAQGLSGATTVSSTAHIAHHAKIPVFSTGGIGGVHRGAELSFDISQDLVALSQIPIIIITSVIMLISLVMVIPSSSTFIQGTITLPVTRFMTQETCVTLRGWIFLRATI